MTANVCQPSEGLPGDPSCKTCEGIGFDLDHLKKHSGHRECPCVTRVRVEAAMPAGVLAMKDHAKILGYRAYFDQYLKSGTPTFMNVGVVPKNAFLYWWFLSRAVVDSSKVRVVSDNLLVSAYFAEKPRDDEAGDTLDKIAREPELLVIELNQIPGRHATAAMALLTVLETRSQLLPRRATWLVSSAGHPWDKSSASWALQIESHVSTHFAKPKDLNPEVKAPPTVEAAVQKGRAPKAAAPREYVAKFPGKCTICGGVIAAGAQFAWADENKNKRHVGCPKEAS